MTLPSVPITMWSMIIGIVGFVGGLTTIVVAWLENDYRYRTLVDTPSTAKVLAMGVIAAWITALILVIFAAVNEGSQVYSNSGQDRGFLAAVIFLGGNVGVLGGIARLLPGR